MRRILLIFVGWSLVACGGTTNNPSATAVASLEPTTQALVASVVPTNTIVVTPAATPTRLPTQTVAPEVTSKPVELDTPTLNDQNAPPTAAPQPTADASSAPSQPVRMVIDAIGLDLAPVSVGLDQRNVPIVPKHDAGWYNLSAQPGQGENVVFWGHVLRWKDAPNVPAPFARVKDVAIGATITVYSADGSQYRYRVTEQVWVTPDQVQYILPVGSERLTLVSCIGDQVIVEGNLEMSHRLITIAEPIR